MTVCFYSSPCDSTTDIVYLATTKSVSPKKVTTFKESVQKEGMFVTSMTRSTKHWLLVSRKRALSLMDKETEDETSPRPKKTKKTVRLQHESEPEADQSNAEEEVEDQLAGEEDALAEDDGDKDDTNSRGNTIEESGDDGDDAYMDDDAEKERESWTDLDDKVSAVDIIVPRSLICSSLLDCSG